MKPTRMPKKRERVTSMPTFSRTTLKKAEKYLAETPEIYRMRVELGVMRELSRQKGEAVKNDTARELRSYHKDASRAVRVLKTVVRSGDRLKDSRANRLRTLLEEFETLFNEIENKLFRSRALSAGPMTLPEIVLHGWSLIPDKTQKSEMVAHAIGDLLIVEFKRIDPNFSFKGKAERKLRQRILNIVNDHGINDARRGRKTVYKQKLVVAEAVKYLAERAGSGSSDQNKKTESEKS